VQLQYGFFGASVPGKSFEFYACFQASQADVPGRDRDFLHEITGKNLQFNLVSIPGFRKNLW
jgi:hypothetical protein